MDERFTANTALFEKEIGLRLGITTIGLTERKTEEVMPIDAE